MRLRAAARSRTEATIETYFFPTLSILVTVGATSAEQQPAPATGSGPAPTLRRFADETGVRFFELKKTTDASTFANLANELRNVYTIGFIPAKLEGKNHKLQVRIQPGLTIRARRGYVASPDHLTVLD